MSLRPILVSALRHRGRQMRAEAPKPPELRVSWSSRSPLQRVLRCVRLPGLGPLQLLDFRGFQPV